MSDNHAVSDTAKDRLDKISGLYNVVFEREADIGGLTHYANSTLTIEQIEAEFKKSSEYKALLLRKGLSPLDIDFVEPNLAISGSVVKNHQETLIAKGITHLLDTSDTDVEYEVNGFSAHLKIKVPATAVISVSDTKKCIEFIRRFIDGQTGVLLIAGTNGDVQAAALLYLWYISQGMDGVIAETLIRSCRPGVNIQSAMLGPWHFTAAKKAVEV